MARLPKMSEKNRRQRRRSGAPAKIGGHRRDAAKIGIECHPQVKWTNKVHLNQPFKEEVCDMESSDIMLEE